MVQEGSSNIVTVCVRLGGMFVELILDFNEK